MLRNYIYAAGGQGLTAILAIGAIALITRTLGPTDYGSYIVLTTIVTLIAIAPGAGPQAAALVISSREPDRRAELHSQIIIVALALLLVTVVAAAIFAGPLANVVAPTLDPRLVAVNLLSLPAMFYAGMATSQLSGAGRIGLVSSQSVVHATVAMLGPLGAALAGNSLAGAVLGTVLATYVSALITWVVARRALGIRRPASFASWRSALALAVPMHIGTTAYWIMLRLDLFVVGALLGRHEAGLYGLALGISQRVGMLSTPLYNAAAWRVSGPDRAVALRTTLQIARLEFAFGIVAAIGGIFLGPLVIRVISGSDFADAAAPLAILIIGTAALPVWAAVGLYLVAHLGGAWTTAKLQIAVAIGSIVGYAVLTQVAGMLGAALVSTVAYLTLLLGGLVLIRRSEPFGWKTLLPTPEFVRLAALIRRRAFARRPRP